MKVEISFKWDNKIATKRDFGFGKCAPVLLSPIISLAKQSLSSYWSQKWRITNAKFQSSTVIIQFKNVKESISKSFELPAETDRSAEKIKGKSVGDHQRQRI